MAKYFMVYHGGKKPESQDDMMKIMEDWNKWMSDMGDALVDPGCGVGMSKTVSPGGEVADNGGSNPAFGYSVISADDMDGAIAKIKDHPFLKHFGGSIEIAQAMEHK